MATKLTIKNLSVSEMDALLNAHRWLMFHIEVNTPHEQLLLEHLIEITDKLELQLTNGRIAHKKKNSLKLTSCQSVAFWQMWASVNLDRVDFAGNTLQTCLDKAHQYNASEWRPNGKPRLAQGSAG